MRKFERKNAMCGVAQTEAYRGALVQNATLELRAGAHCFVALRRMRPNSDGPNVRSNTFFARFDISGE